ncbi:hypothetical protein RI820_000982 [Pluralibacter gergoviae]|nr:hypothetical protein [Pluralibacter gergoviae]ELC3016123.1 hypothetical protein [Pluralibacter gergoviae]ELC3021103.1 hypothetical protein [Pluralibacter gergoviae]
MALAQIWPDAAMARAKSNLTGCFVPRADIADIHNVLINGKQLIRKVAIFHACSNFLRKNKDFLNVSKNYSNQRTGG